MKEIPVAQILHPLGNVHHELHQCLHGNVLGDKARRKIITIFLQGNLHVIAVWWKTAFLSLKCVAMRHGHKLHFCITNSTNKVLKEE